jgi:hypothetical protein
VLHRAECFLAVVVPSFHVCIVCARAVSVRNRSPERRVPTDDAPAEQVHYGSRVEPAHFRGDVDNVRQADVIAIPHRARVQQRFCVILAGRETTS